MNTIMLIVICVGFLSSLNAMESPRDADLLDSPKDKELFYGPMFLGLEKSHASERIHKLLLEYYIFSWAAKPQNQSSRNTILTRYALPTSGDQGECPKRRVQFEDENKTYPAGDLKEIVQQEIAMIRRHWGFHKIELEVMNGQARGSAWSLIQECLHH